MRLFSRKISKEFTTHVFSVKSVMIGKNALLGSHYLRIISTYSTSKKIEQESFGISIIH